MDEVNHVKMVVSLCYFVVLDYSLCLLDGYECNKNLLIGEKSTKVLFCRFLEWLVALSGKRYITTIFTWFTSSMRLHPPTFASFFIFFNLSKAYNSAVPNAAIIYTVSLSLVEVFHNT